MISTSFSLPSKNFTTRTSFPDFVLLRSSVLVSIDISFFPRADIATASVQTFNSHSEFFKEFQTPEPRSVKDGRLWSAATFEHHHRSKNNAVNARPQVIGFDFDGPKTKDVSAPSGVPDGDMAAVFAWLRAENVLAAAHHTHTSYDCPEGYGKWRIILALDRAVSVDEFSALWSRIAAILAVKPDPTCRGVDRAFYMPSCPIEATPRPTRYFDGAPLPVDEWLKRRAVVGVDSGAPGDLNAARVKTEPKTEKQWLASLESAEIKNEALNMACFRLAKLRRLAGASYDDVPALALGALAKNPSKIQDHVHAAGIAERAVAAGVADAERELAEIEAKKAKATEDGLTFFTNVAGQPTWCVENLNTLFQKHPDTRGKLKKNLLQGSLEILEGCPFCPNGGPLTDDVAAPALEWASRAFETYGPPIGKTFGSTSLALAAAVSACEPYDPIRDYFTSLPTWDGVPRLETWLSRYANAENTPYSREIGKRWLMQVVARTFVPACEAPGVLMLTGPQGAGKSSVPVALLGHIPGAVTDTLPRFDDKDFHVKMAQCAIAEISELMTFKKADTEAIKSAITTRSSWVRAPYDRIGREWKRRGVLLGTTNDDRFLTDDTGNRRFWTVKVSAVDLAALKADAEMLWSEALTMWSREGLGCQLLPPEMWRVQAEEAAAFEIEDDAEHRFADAVSGKGVQRVGFKGDTVVLAEEQLDQNQLVRWLTVPQAHTLCGTDPLSRSEQRMLAKWARKAGWNKKHKRFGNGRFIKIFEKDGE